MALEFVNLNDDTDRFPNESDKEYYLRQFKKIDRQFLYQQNDYRTRHSMIQAYYQMFDRSFMGEFVDVTTNEQIQEGRTDIRVQTPSGKLLTIEEFCESMDRYNKMFNR